MWSSQMAYILGFIYADGSLQNSPSIRAKYLRVSSTDKPVLVYMKNTLEAEHSIYTEKVPDGSKEKFLLQIGSHKMYDALEKYGLTPNKSLSVLFPKVPAKYLAHFVRGYFDGDGCVYIEHKILKNGSRSPKRLRVIFTSGSRKFLEILDENLATKLHTKTCKIYYSSRAYRLIYNTSESIELCKFMYAYKAKDEVGFSFDRKFNRFKKYLLLRSKKIDKTLQSILEC